MSDKKHFSQGSIQGDPNIGMYSLCTDDYCIIPENAKGIDVDVLGVKVKHATFMETPFAGIFAAGNNHGAIVSWHMKDYEIKQLKKLIKNVLVLKTDYTAIGNLILMNDKGIIISPLLRKHQNEIQEFFKLPTEVATIGTLYVVGSLAYATNKGCLVAPLLHDSELKILESVLGVKVDVGTVNFGSPFPGSGVIANSNGVVAGISCSGPEMQRVEETFGFI